MTQPSTLTKTFDTSLVDVNRSFSSTETDTSGSTAKSSTQAPASRAAMSASEAYTAVSNNQLYDQLASTYDTDGNILQAVDDLELVDLLPEFISLVREDGSAAGPVRMLDFGCGTGRNTAKLLTSDWGEKDVEVPGWDASQAMLDVAASKCSAAVPATANVIEIKQVDFASPSAIPESARGSFDGLISTLVLEHLPADTFFEAIADLLKPGGIALVTNMHSEMGKQTKAGYKTASGERVKGNSWVYEVDETVETAESAGLGLVGEVKEGRVDEKMIQDGHVGSRGEKWKGVKVWYGLMLRKQA